MTLVVAEMFPSGPRLLSDTMLSGGASATDEYTANPFTAGALKVVVLHRALCVAFSGGVEAALDVIQDVGAAVETGFDLDWVLRRLKVASARGPSSPDFIVASLAPTASITRVAQGRIHRGESRAHIGDSGAYEEFRRNIETVDRFPHEVRTRPLPPHLRTAFRRWSRFLPAFQQVIESSEFPSVAGLPISVAPIGRGFRYESTAVLGTPPDASLATESDLKNTNWGSAAQGRFGFALKTPDDPGIGAIGALFPHGRFGVLYYPVRSRVPIVYRDVDDQALAIRVERDFGFRLGTRSIKFETGDSELNIKF